MTNGFFSNFKNGVEKVKNNPQLFYTVLVAAAITAAFIFISNRFAGIANDAQERLINVRVGSIHDAFVSFAGDKLDDSAYLNERIRQIVEANRTIQHFRIIKKEMIVDESGANRPAFAILASDDGSEVGLTEPDAEFLYSLAQADPKNSITMSLEEGGERYFRTARAITGPEGVLAVAETYQTLSQADRLIEENLRNATLLLIAIVVGILLLFLRHSKIIDYMALYKKLKEVDELKDDFISMASHELRTPLTIIRGYTEFIREAPDTKPDIKDYTEKIDHSAKELDTLIADILDVSRIEQGRMSFNLQKFNPAQSIEEVVSSLAGPAGQKGLAIGFEKSDVPDQFIMADQERLHQVLVNIIGNAVKYTLKGEIKVRQYAEKGSLFIRVSDTGVGLSEEERERLFEKFYRAKAKETREVPGTGLGLWITKKIVLEMRGKISVESIKGVGSHFIISFPLSI